MTDAPSSSLALCASLCGRDSRRSTLLYHCCHPARTRDVPLSNGRDPETSETGALAMSQERDCFDG